MEDEIKNDIANKINSGVYKLTMKENSRSPLWSLYATITEANNGSLIEGYVCCTNCKAICNFLKFRFAALYNHECYKSLGISKHNKDFSENTMQDFADRNITLAEQSFETGGGEITLKEGEKVECKIPTSPVWKSFALSLDDEGQNVEAVINCIECKEIIECSKYGQRYSTHKCITATGSVIHKVVPSRVEVSEKLKAELAERINTGYYKLCINLRGLSFRPWKVFAIITRADGKQIRGYYYCTKCRKILKSMCKSNGLNCHKCVLDIKQTDIVNYVQTKITSGVYKMKPYGEKSSNPVWERFSLISRPNDSLVVGMVCCQNCKMVMKYNELLGGDDRLLQHICMEGGEDTNTRKRADTNKLCLKSKKEICTKIEQGIYKLQMKSSYTSIVWKILAPIIKDDGSLLHGYIYCTKCKDLLQHKLSTSCHIYRHPCILELPLNSKKRKLRDMEADDTIVLSDDSSTISVLSKDEVSRSNEEGEDEQDSIWSRFEHISLGDGSTMEGVVSCRQCKMILNYDGETKLHLQNHKCFSMASASLNEAEFISEPTETSCTINDITPEFRNVNVKMEYNSPPPVMKLNYDSKESVESTTNNKNVYRSSSIHSNEAIKIEKQPIQCMEIDNSIKESVPIYDEEIASDDIICLDSPEAFSEEDKDTDIQETLNIVRNWIIEDFTPVNTIQSAGFRKLISHWLSIGAKYGENQDIENLVPDPRTISKRIKDIADTKKTEIKLKIKEKAKNTVISINFWSETVIKKNFLFVTLHFNENTEISDIVLGVKSMDFSQTNKQTVRKKLVSLLSDFGVDNLKNMVIVTENDSPVAEALDDDCIHLKCASYLFTKALDTTLETTAELSDIIIQAKAIRKYMKSSNKQNSLNTTPQSSHSKSYYSLFKTISNNWTKIYESLATRKELLGLTADTFSSLQCLVKLCQKFEYIFKHLQETKSPSLCFVIPSIKRLQMMCEPSSKDNSEIKAFKLKLSQNIEEIWLPNINIWHKAACFLYPPANQEQQEHLQDIKDFCILKIKELPQIDADQDFSQATEDECSSTIVNENDDMDFFFPNLFKRTKSSPTNNAEEEINHYCREHFAVDRKFNVLQWWRNKAAQYPHLSRLAVQILTIPACTANRGHILPLAKNLSNENITILDTKNLENILILS